MCLGRGRKLGWGGGRWRGEIKGMDSVEGDCHLSSGDEGIQGQEVYCKVEVKCDVRTMYPSSYR